MTMGFIFRGGCEDLFIRLESADTLGMGQVMDNTVIAAIITAFGQLLDFLTKLIDFLQSFNQTRKIRKLLRSYYDEVLVKKIAVSKKVPESYLWGVLDKIGLENVENREDKAYVHLEKSADRFKEFETKIDNLPESYQRISNLRKKAYWRLNNGSFDKVEKLYLKAVNRVTDELEKAATLACFAEFEMLQPNPASYRKAANNYAQAADCVADFDTKQTLEYRFNQAKTLCELGDEFGDNDELLKAVKQYKQLLSEINRTDDSESWATTQNNLGGALTRLGERESGTARLEEAVTAFREALQERTRERVPLDWAMTQNNLGEALRNLGEREPGTARLEEAVTAYRDALQEYTRERVPLEWAMTQNNLGAALARLGERESGTARLKEAVTAFREALQERTRERVPLQWAKTQNNLGGALLRLGERESGTARLEEAAKAFRNALEIFRGNAPYYEEAVANNLARVLALIDERKKTPQP
jgi:tetratricopeptide (TPR) repeat protein